MPCYTTHTQTHVVAHTSTCCPAVKWAAVIAVPGGNSPRRVTLNSHSLRFGGVPALAKWPRSGPDTYVHTDTQQHRVNYTMVGAGVCVCVCARTYPMFLVLVHGAHLEGVVALFGPCPQIDHLVVDNLQ